MKFSICISAHRLDRRLRNTLTLLQDLDYERKDFEICLLLNTEQESSILKFISLVDSFKRINQSLGPSRAKNEAIAMAKHEWVVLLDSDDFLVPSTLKQYQEIILKYPSIQIGYEFSSINFIQQQSFYPPDREGYAIFFQEQKDRAVKTAACGRPVLIRKSSFPQFDPAFGFAEERKLACDYWKTGKDTHIMDTISYVYNWNDTGIKKDEVALKKIEKLAQRSNPLIVVAKSSSFLTEKDKEFIQKAFLLEGVNL